jgi:hypothetical protein
VEKVLSQASGIVLDVGPGSGDWMYLFSPERNERITKLLLLEPNKNFHQALHARAESLGLADKYEVVGSFLEDLEQDGYQKKTIDTIVTTHVLCSVNARRAMAGL